LILYEMKLNNSAIKDIPKYWVAAMAKHGVSARSVAIRADVSLPYLYKVMKIRASPTLGYVAKIEAAMIEAIKDREIKIRMAYDSVKPKPQLGDSNNETSGDTFE
jgi:predicted transcriptional regulator